MRLLSPETKAPYIQRSNELQPQLCCLKSNYTIFFFLSWQPCWKLADQYRPWTNMKIFSSCLPLRFLSTLGLLKICLVSYLMKMECKKILTKNHDYSCCMAAPFLPWSLYSCDCFLFPKIKSKFCGYHLKTCKVVPMKDFQHWEHYLCWCVASQENYFKRDEVDL